MIFKKIKKAGEIAQKKYKEIIEDAQEINQPQIKEVPPLPKSKSEDTIFAFSLSNMTKIILIALALIVLKDFIINISDVLIMFLISVLFAAALDPMVDKLQKYKIPRGISVLFIFTILIGIFGLFISTLIPLLSNELSGLGGRVGLLVENFANGSLQLPGPLNSISTELAREIQGQQFTANLQTQLLNYSDGLQDLAGNFIETLISISNGLANFFIVLLLTYFMIVDEEEIDKFILRVSPRKYGEYITAKTNNIKEKVGQWLVGQIVLMFVVGLATYIGLKILGTDYAFTLALFAGITELIPVIGPWIGLLAAIPIAFNQGSTMLIWVTILYFVIQRLENNLFVPVIMNKATGLNPIVVIMAMLIGNKFLGVIGIIISIPIAAILGIFLEDILIKKEKVKTSAKSY